MVTERSPRLIVDIETGRKSLMVYYDAEKNDYGEAITNALAFHGLKEGQVSVFAYPVKYTHLSTTHTMIKKL